MIKMFDKKFDDDNDRMFALKFNCVILSNSNYAFFHFFAIN